MSDLKITITVDGRHPNARRMAAILEKAVDVLSVEMRFDTAAGAPSGSPRRVAPGGTTMHERAPSSIVSEDTLDARR